MSIEIEDIDGIGSTTAKKLASVGIASVYELAASLPLQLAEDLKCTKETAEKYIEGARKVLAENDLISKEFKSAKDHEEDRKNILRLSTGSVVLDNLLGGGIETRAVTEFYGEFGSGKSQLCHTAAVMASQPIEAGGFNAGTIWLDSEGTFRPERLRKIAEGRGLDAEKVLEVVKAAKVSSSAQLEIMVKQLGRYIEQFKAKLVIVDSIANLHRAEYLGRGMLADRQQRLNQIMQNLLRKAEVYDAAVIITNQVHTSPDTMFGDPTKPVGGNIIGHNSTYRLYLRKAGEARIARMVDSPCHAYSECRFTVTDRGIDDIEEEIEALQKKSK